MIRKTMKAVGAVAVFCLVGSFASPFAPADENTRHDPLKVSYTAKAVSKAKYALTFKFDQNPSYSINLKPEPKLDLVRGESSILSGAKLVPGNARKEPGSTYYGKLEPINVVVQKVDGLQARFTYFFCSKKDGFCARKIDKVELKLP